jgi:hypothetical protein
MQSNNKGKGEKGVEGHVTYTSPPQKKNFLSVPGDHHVKQNKSDSKSQVLYVFPHV